MNPSNTRPLTVLVTHGEPLVAQGLASVLAQHSDFEVHYKAPPPGSTVDVLVTRESEVLTLLVQGQCNKSIARDLSIALGTVKSHVKAILGKLDASSRTHAASIAVQRGLVDQDADQPSEPVALRMSFPHGQAANRRMSFEAA